MCYISGSGRVWVLIHRTSGIYGPIPSKSSLIILLATYQNEQGVKNRFENSVAIIIFDAATIMNVFICYDNFFSLLSGAIWS